MKPTEAAPTPTVAQGPAAPLLDERRAADVVREVSEALRRISFAPPPAPQSLAARQTLTQRALSRELFGQDPASMLKWVGQPGRAGWTLVQLFGHLTELVINRLNWLPDKHFLAFLNEAGIDLLPPQAAHAEVVFQVGPDAPPAIHVPKGTQVATQQTETRPEIVFETQERCTVIPTELSQFIAIDPVRWTPSPPTSLAGNFGRAGSPPTPEAAPAAGIPAFEGLLERDRVFFIGDDSLFSFSDATSRSHSAIMLQFVFAEAGDPAADGWHLEWQYWNVPPASDASTVAAASAAAPGWQPLPDGSVEDQTNNFSANGTVILRDLPELGQTVVAGRASRWIACRLTGGSGRGHLPVVSSVMGRRRMRVDMQDPATAAASAVTAIQVSSAFVNIKLDAAAAAGFMPFGPRPDRLDAFYVRSDDAFTKPGASVRLEFAGLPGIPVGTTSANLDALLVVWEYYCAAGWVELGRSTRATVTPARLEFADTTQALTAGPPVTPVPGLAAAALLRPGAGGGAPAGGAARAGSARGAGRGRREESPTPPTSAAGTGTLVPETPAVSFRIPTGEGSDLVFQPVEVNGQAGYWVRARIEAGNYSVPAYVEILNRLAGSYRFHEPQTFAPLVKRFRLTYGDFRSITDPAPVQLAASRVDADERDLTPDAPGALAQAGNSFAPFSAPEEGPALYLGFVSIREAQAGQSPPAAFPAGEWVQILLDVVELDVVELDVAEPETGGAGQGQNRTVAPPPPVAWEYRSSQGWKPLQVSDGTHDLRLRGYLGFFAPHDHVAGAEFGKTAFWLRSRTHHEPPAAVARAVRSVRPDEHGVRTVRLDASRSQAFNGQYLGRYEWRLVPEARDAVDRGDGAATSAGGGMSPANPGAGADEAARFISPRLKGIRLNIVPVLNSITIEDEMLALAQADGGVAGEGVASVAGAGSSAAPASPALTSGGVLSVQPIAGRASASTAGAVAGGAAGTPSANQRFVLQRTPVLPDIQLEVREEEAGRAQWVPWQRVDSFYELDGPSRSFVLDPINGWVQFGDDHRGKIPPVGTDNVRAASYRTHNGGDGNVGGGEISVLRNPKDELVQISGVNNPEPAVGGSAAETIDDIRRRGPQLLKHRRQAVTSGGFEWLGREASTEIAQIFALPARDQAGQTQPGRVSVVVVPDMGERPEPSAALLRRTQEYLEARALTSLTDPGRGRGTGIFFSGPEYIEARVAARVVPADPKNADEVALSIRQRLAAFLHPLGWPLGRDVHLGDVYAEIEAVDGVDHVVYLELSGSIEQHNLVFAVDEIAFDGAGFEPGEEVVLAAGDGAVLVEDLVIAPGGITREEIRFVTPQRPLGASVAELARSAMLLGRSPSGGSPHRLAVAPFNIIFDNAGLVTRLRRGYQVPFDIPAGSEVSTLDRRVRLQLADNLVTGDSLATVGIYGFKVGDTATLVRNDNTVVTGDLRIAAVEPGLASAAAFGTEALAVRIWLERGGVDGVDGVDWTHVDALMSSEGFVRLPGVQPVKAPGPVAAHATPAAEAGAPAAALVVDVVCLAPGTQVCVVSGNRRDPRLAFLPVASITQPDERIIVPEGTLVVSGSHNIEMALDD